MIGQRTARGRRATLVGVAVLLGQHSAVADPPLAAEVERLREAHAQLLDAHHWNRDDPAVVAGENDLTQRALDLLAPQQTAPPELDALLESLGGDALGGHLRALPHPRVTMVAAWLRRHRDGALLHTLPRASIHGSLADALARVGAPEAVAFLVESITTGGLWERENYCLHSLRLPTASVTTLSRALVPSLTPVNPEHLGPACLSLLVRSPEGLRAVSAQARTLARSEVETVFATELLLGLLLESSGRHVESAALLDRLLGGRGEVSSGWQLDAASGLSVIAPSLDSAAPTTLRAVTRVVREMGFPRWRAVPLRLRLRDPSLLADAESMLRAPRVDREIAEASTLSLAWMAPARRAYAAQSALFFDLPTRPGVDVLPAQLDLWLEALRATDRCADAACLADLAARGTDETASRAVMLLGDAGLATLSPAQAAAVVRRVVLRGAPWLAAALTVTLRTCPPMLRGLASADEGALPDVRALRFDVYLQQLQARCATGG